MKTIRRVILDREGYKQWVIYRVCQGLVIGVFVYDYATGVMVERVIGQMEIVHA